MPRRSRNSKNNEPNKKRKPRKKIPLSEDEISAIFCAHYTGKIPTNEQLWANKRKLVEHQIKTIVATLPSEAIRHCEFYEDDAYSTALFFCKIPKASKLRDALQPRQS